MLDFISLVKKIQLPAYVYDLDGIRARAQFFHAQLHLNRLRDEESSSSGRIHYAMKANGHPLVLREIRDSGAGVDVVSGGEIDRAVQAGFHPDQIVFSGVGKTKEEILKALHLGIFQINIESVPELKRVISCAKELKKTAKVALRMNPDVEAQTHPYVTTGFRENKFGLDFSEISDLLRLIREGSESIELQGLALHIGSQIRTVEPFAAAVKKTLELYRSIQSLGFHLTTFDVGGGVGMDYQNEDQSQDEKFINQYFKVVADALVGHVERVIFEPGRALVARFGTLLTEIQYIKRTPHKNFIIVNTGMHHLLRPALYQAYHRIEPVLTKVLAKKEGTRKDLYDVVGPICESSDVLGASRTLPADLAEGDILGIFDVGAYGAVMASHYNLQPPATEVFVSNGQIITH